MKYKKGDRVKIRTWESMEIEYGCVNIYKIAKIRVPNISFIMTTESFLRDNVSDRIVTIKDVRDEYYKIIEDNGWYKGQGWKWVDNMIEYSLEKKSKVISSLNRFSMLDIR